MTTASRPAAPFDPGSRAYLLDPQATVQPLFPDHPVVVVPATRTYVVLGYAEARAVLKDTETYSSHAFKGLPVRPDLRPRIPEAWERVGQLIQGSQLVHTDPPAHTAQRKAMQRTFTRGAVERERAEIERIADELLDGLVARGEFDLVHDYALQLSVRVIGAMLALPQEQIPGFLSWIGDVFTILAPIDLRAEDVTVPDDVLVATFERLHTAYLLYVDLLEERRANPGDDMASAMLALRDDDGGPLLSNDQVLSHMVGMTAAGTDTTAGLITNLVRLFTEHPDQLQLVLDDPSRWDNAVQEGLRRSSVALHALRISTRPSTVGGVEIPAGSTVQVALGAANADPSVFPEPLRFDVLRRNARDHLALGIGRHKCLGAPLAPPETRIALERLYARLPGLRADLAPEPEFAASPVVRVVDAQRVVCHDPAF